MGIKKRLEDIFAATAFAERGEFETAAQIEARRNVLLVTRGLESDRASFRYALSVSKRMDAGLEVLYMAPDHETRALLKEFEGEARHEGVEFKTSRATGCIKKEVLSHTDRRSDIRLVVIESSGDLDSDCGEKELLKTWKKRLGCPLVVVSDAAKA